MKYGILYGVSVGPGDPELMTVKAVRILERCPVVAAPRTAGEKTLALDIASGAADLRGKTILNLEFAMTRDPAELAASHRAAADTLENELREGRDVAMLNLGEAIARKLEDDPAAASEIVRSLLEFTARYE